MGEAADEVLYQALCSGLPEVTDHTAMARDYLATFSRLLKYRTDPESPANVPRASARRRGRAAAAVAAAGE